MANQPQQDKRRFNAPEGARPLEFAPQASTSKLNILDDAGQREDGRAPGEVRGICEYLQVISALYTAGSANTARLRLISLKFHRRRRETLLGLVESSGELIWGMLANGGGSRRNIRDSATHRNRNESASTGADNPAAAL